MPHEKIFLAGLPGTGKSNFGELLSNKFGYVHFDMEKKDWPQQGLKHTWEKSREKFIDSIKGDKVILNWGFPVTFSLLVKEILNKGYTFIWFEGSIVCAEKHFLIRENGGKKD